MAYEVKINTGAIFKNDKKADTHPDYRGKIKIDPSIIDADNMIEISMWLATAQSGVKYMNAKVATPWKKEESYTKKSEPVKNEPIDDEIGF